MRLGPLAQLPAEQETEDDECERRAEERATRSDWKAVHAVRVSTKGDQGRVPDGRGERDND